MGDMADYALDIAARQEEHYERYKDAPLAVQYEEGIIDEHGFTIGDPSSYPGLPIAPTCSCGSKMVKKMGQYGAFYGCSSFPKCKNSRSAYV